MVTKQEILDKLAKFHLENDLHHKQIDDKLHLRIANEAIRDISESRNKLFYELLFDFQEYLEGDGVKTPKYIIYRGSREITFCKVVEFIYFKTENSYRYSFFPVKLVDGNIKVVDPSGPIIGEDIFIYHIYDDKSIDKNIHTERFVFVYSDEALIQLLNESIITNIL